MPAKRLLCIAIQMPPESSGDVDEVADGCGEECEMILVALRWLLLFGVPACRDPCQLDAGRVRMSLMWPGDIPVPPARPSLELSVPGKATRDPYIHFWG